MIPVASAGRHLSFLAKTDRTCVEVLTSQSSIRSSTVCAITRDERFLPQRRSPVLSGPSAGALSATPPRKDRHPLRGKWHDSDRSGPRSARGPMSWQCPRRRDPPGGETGIVSHAAMPQPPSVCGDAACIALDQVALPVSCHGAHRREPGGSAARVCRIIPSDHSPPAGWGERVERAFAVAHRKGDPIEPGNSALDTAVHPFRITFSSLF